MTGFVPCRYLTRSEEAYAYTEDAAPRRVPGPLLCAWALESDTAVASLTGVPTWVQKHASAGVMPSGACDGCPAYEPRPTSEGEA